MAPSSPRPQPDYSKQVQKLWEWLDGERQCVYGYSGPDLNERRQFYPLSVLEAYFENRNKLQRILYELFPDTDDLVEVDTIIDRGYLAVFAILLKIGKGEYIDQFVHHESLRDDRFPLESVAPPDGWPRTRSSDIAWEDFKLAQWMFYPYTFGRNQRDIYVSPRRILPIVESKFLKAGGSSKIFKIKIYPDYDRLESTQQTEETIEVSGHTYVLKIYSDVEGEDNYNSEVNTFRKLGTAEVPIVTFYGSFVQDGTYNVLLQYADGGTLEDYFQSTEPPRSPSDVKRFWESLFGLLKALWGIHDMNPGEDDGRKGWHQDIKPTNILVIRGDSGSPYHCHFVLADMGLSHYKRSRGRPGDVTSPDVGGTREYGAPECHRRDPFMQQLRLRIRQSVDVWSLGCVFSEAVVWMCCLRTGLSDYRAQRRIYTDSQQHIQDAGCFHDGRTTLSPVVKQFHQQALNFMPVSDTLTKSALTLIGSDMMVPQTHRSNVEQLYYRSQDILQAPKGDESVPGLQWQGSSWLDGIQRQGTGWTNNPAPRPSSTFHQPPGQPLNWSPPQSSGAISKRSSSIREEEPRAPMWQPPMTHRNRAISPEVPDLEHDPDDDDSASSPNSPAHIRNGGRSAPGFPGRGLTFGNDADSQKPHHLGMPPGLKHELDDLAPLRETELEEERPRRNLTKAQTFGSQRSQEFVGLSAKQKGRASDPTVPLAQNHGNDTAMLPQSRRANNRFEIPYLSVAMADAWVKARKRDAHLPHMEHLAFLDKRDHVFLVDNSMSMRHHWTDVAYLLRILAWTVKKSDEDGLDLYYTMSRKPVHSKKSSALINDMKKTTPYGESDITGALGRILSIYQQKLDESASSRTSFDPFTRHPFRPMTVYVFTDAVWRQDCDGARAIVSMIEKLDNLGIPNDSKQVGVQFISFGNDPICLAKLEHLDDDLKGKYGRDIVDTERSNGNVWKMFLGSINRIFDES